MRMRADHFPGSGIMKRIILSSIMIFLLFSCGKQVPVEIQPVVVADERTTKAIEAVGDTTTITEPDNPLDVYLNNNTEQNKIHLDMENPLLRMEYPEYHSFIYRYSKLRDEQVILLNDYSIKNNIAVDIQNSESLNSAGFGLYERKEYAEAIRFFREAAYLDPTNVYAHYNLACTLSLLRDSIWADPESDINYFEYVYAELYRGKYNLYNKDRYASMHDEICRDEIYDHLTLAILQSERYLEKAPADSDLNGIHNHLRFERLMNNIKDEQAKSIHGVYYVPGTDTKAVFFMLDGRNQQILMNDELGLMFSFGFGENVIKEEKNEYTLDELITGHEYLVAFVGESIWPKQWEYIPPTLNIYTLEMYRDIPYLANKRAPNPSRPFDFIYHKDTLKPNNATENSFSFYGYDLNQIQFINIYKYPYQSILYEDSKTLFTYLNSNTSIDVTDIAIFALLYEKYEMLDLLIKNYSGISLDELMLTACMYGNVDFFKKLEAGEYEFSMETFINEKGAKMFLIASNPDNMAFLISLYQKYYDILPEQQKDYLRNDLGWDGHTEGQIKKALNESR
jgi:hypothetical protein